MQVTVLGSSSFIPTFRRSWSSMLLDLGSGEKVLIDAGSRRLIGFRRDVLSINHIYITHRHADHVAFIGGLIQRIIRNGRTRPLHITCPTDTYNTLHRYIRFFNRGGLPKFVKIRIFTPGKPVHIDHFPKSKTDVWAAAACHTTMAAGYSFRQGDRNVVFAPDTGPHCPTIRALAKGATALFHDCTFPIRYFDSAFKKGHSSPEGAGYQAARAGVKTLVLFHISGVRSRDEEVLKAGASHYFDGKILVAYDNMTFTF